MTATAGGLVTGFAARFPLNNVLRGGLVYGFRDWVLTAQRATLCDMRIVTHREMRNQSGEILREVADGETIQVTNNGQLAALIVPPGADLLADLVSRGQVRPARQPLSSLRSIVRRKAKTSSEAMLTDARGRW